MHKLSFNDIKEEQIIDTRLQKEFQAGSLKQALNVPFAKFEKVAKHLLSLDTPIVFILSEENAEQISNLNEQSEKLGFKTKGYLLLDEILTTEMQVTKTIPASEFLETEKDYILLDVREQEAVTKKAPEKNLVTISIEELAQGYLALDADKEIYTLCGSGNSATTAASFLNKQGRKATVIEGGVTAILNEQKEQ